MRKALRSLWRIITAPFRFIFRIWRAIRGWFSRRADEIRIFFTEDVEDAPVGDALNKAFENPTGLFEHLDALRKHLFRAVMALGITTAFSFAFFTPSSSCSHARWKGGWSLWSPSRSPSRSAR